jgi:raffinose/stachyose/melibiose transport system substrate-binding protein
MRPSTARIGAWLGFAAVCAFVPACGGDDSGRTEIEFFQFKGEAIGTFDEIIADFEAENPDIDVVQNSGQGDTAFRIRLVRNDIPDVISLNAGASWAENAPRGVFYDFSDDPIIDEINPAIVDIINALGVAEDGEINGLPFANNASGVIYNKDLFEQHEVEIPTTWDEFIDVLETFEAAGVTPIYGTLLEQWTSLPSWNALASNVAPPAEFFPELDAEETSFEEAYPEVAERLFQLFQYTQEDSFSRNYNDGNQAFANGESAMYLQGIWAIPVIRSFNPEFEIGVFPYPVQGPNDTNLVSGVDVAITMGREPAHLEESMRFINYLMTPEVQEFYVEAQSAFPTLEGTEPTDPALVDLVPYFDDERLVGFTDHYIPPAIPLQAINQQFLIDGDQDAYLTQLDEEWDKVARRRPDREE